MVFFNGDRVCAKRSNSGSKFLEFGRIQEYVDVEDSFNSGSQCFSNYGDVLKLDDTLFSSTLSVSPPPLASDGGKLLVKRVPLLHLVSPSSSMKKGISVGSLLGGGDGGSSPEGGAMMPGLTSPIMMKRSRSQPDNIGRAGGGKEENERSVKRRIIWDNNHKTETELISGATDERVYRVVDRKFSVGQSVTPAHTHKKMKGTILEVVPLASVHVPFSDPENKHENGHVIRDLAVSEIKPISPIFSGVTIEFNGWLGQVTDVKRQVIYKLEDSTYLTRICEDSVLIRNSRIAPTQSSSSSAKDEAQEQRRIQNQFSYPFMKNTEMPFTGKIERFSKLRLDRLKIEEQEDKENNDNFGGNRYSTRSRTGSSSFTPPLSVDQRKRNKTDRENFITAIVESVSIVSINVRWTGRLPAYLIKQKPGDSSEKAKQVYKQEMPFTTIRLQDVKKVRPLYINPAMYFEKNGLCAYKPEKRNDEIMIPERLWAHDLYKEAGENGGVEVVGPFNLSTISLSPVRSNADEKRKDSWMKYTDDHGKAKRKRCHQDEEMSKAEESPASGRRTIIVRKHFVRHTYRVVWEDSSSKQRSSFGNTTEWWKGTDLHPLTQEHKLCLGLIHSHLYVLPRPGSSMYGQCDYGVVVEKPEDNKVVVEWLKIQNGGVLSVKAWKYDNMLDIDKHPKFNELHEGRIVIRGKEAVTRYKCSREFMFGTIVKIDRLCLGQISVYCPIQEKIIELWPHMVELFRGMSMQELIAHKVVGVKKKFGVSTEQQQQQPA